MVATTSSDYKLTWRGATVLREIDSRVDEAMERLKDEVQSYLTSNLHRYTGQMADESFAEIEVVRGKKRKLVAGSDAPHTLFHEIRYHAQLRETLDIFAPKLSQYIREALSG